MKQTVFALHILLLVLFLGAPLVSGAGVENQPIEVTSGELLVDEVGQTARFSETVIARQGDMVIYADQLTLQFAGEKEIRRLVAHGKVRIVRGAEVATAEQAIYDVVAQIITLTGAPKVHQGANSIAGETIIVDLENRRSTVSGDGSSRINATFQPPEEKQP